jgi:peptidoglycan-associated lipoprotein
MKNKLFGFGIVLLMSMTGCTTTPTDCQPPSCDGKLEPAPLATSGKYGQNSQPIDPTVNLATLPPVRRVYFDFDVSDVRQDQRQILETNAAYLLKNQQLKIRLEGHADERGSKEYNLALGERRAQSVKRYLGMMGVQESRINTLSYGEEKPAVEGHDESAWRLNRRVEIIFFGQ